MKSCDRRSRLGALIRSILDIESSIQQCDAHRKVEERTEDADHEQGNMRCLHDLVQSERVQDEGYRHAEEETYNGVRGERQRPEL